jgi:hypothetical protein
MGGSSQQSGSGSSADCLTEMLGVCTSKTNASQQYMQVKYTTYFVGLTVYLDTSNALYTPWRHLLCGLLPRIKDFLIEPDLDRLPVHPLIPVNSLERVNTSSSTEWLKLVQTR